MTIVIIFALLLTMLVLRLPVAFALTVSGAIGIYVTGGNWGPLLGLLQTIPYRTSTHYTLLTIPMFVLMAQLAAHSKLTANIYSSLSMWLQRLPGGLALASLVASAGLAAVSGSSIGTAATMGKVAVPEMRRHGYDAPFAVGTVAASGTLAVMIPPSTALVLYAIVTEVSVGAILLAGLIPGILSTIINAVVILVLALRRRSTFPKPTMATWRERLVSLRSFWPLPPLILAVLGGIYTGAVTVVEAAGLGAAGMFVVLMVMGRSRWTAIRAALKDTAPPRQWSSRLSSRRIYSVRTCHWRVCPSDSSPSSMRRV